MPSLFSALNHQDIFSSVFRRRGICAALSLCVWWYKTQEHWKSHPDVPTKAAICAAVLPTELTTSVSAPASNIIHVISVLPNKHRERRVCLTVKFKLLRYTFPVTYLKGRQTSAPCIRARARCSSHPLRVAGAVYTCLLFLCKQRASEGSSHTVNRWEKAHFHSSISK